MSSGVKAIVFDANVFGKSVEPNVGVISDWAGACTRHGAELWIPEVVAWEMAERVVTSVREFEDMCNQHNARRRRWGFIEFPHPRRIELEDVVNSIEEAGALIVSLNGDSARQALRDQVLQIGPAERKIGVKTGAADSAWLRSVLDANDQSFDRVVLVTGDAKAVERICGTLDVTPPLVVKNLGELRNSFGQTIGATIEQRRNLEAFLRDVVLEFGDGDIRTIADLRWPWNWWDNVRLSDDWEYQSSDLSISGDAVVLGEVTYDAWSQSINATVRVEVLVVDSYARQDDWGDFPEYRDVSYIGPITFDFTLFDGDGVGAFDNVVLEPVE